MYCDLARDAHGTRWVRDETASGLPWDNLDGQFAAWCRAGAVEIVKDGPHRTVYRARPQGLDLHIKHYRPFGLRSRLRAWLRPVKARREFELGQLLRARGVPTPAPLAWGTSSPWSPGSWLITSTVPDSQPLLGFFESVLPSLPPAGRMGLTDALGKFVAGLHVAGVFHHDLHPGNILAGFDSDGTPHLWLIDLHAVSVLRRWSWPACQRNLVVFNRYFALRSGRSDRCRFWKAYIAALGRSAPEPGEQIARALEDETLASNLDFWRARDGRSLRTNRYYRRVRAKDVRGYVVRDLDSDLVRSMVADPDRYLTRAEARTLKHSPSSTVIALDVPAGASTMPIVLKRFDVRSPLRRAVGCIRPTAALRSWVFGHGLRERYLPTARPLAVLQRYRGGLPTAAYLLTERIEGAIDLREWLGRLAVLPSALRVWALRRRVRSLGRLIRDLHHRGLSHRDLKAANLLTPVDPEDDRFWFIDLVGVRRATPVRRAARVQNLARLHASFLDRSTVSRSEKLRFLRSYLEWGLRGKTGWKSWWQAIAAATQAKVARNLRRQRPLA